MYRGRAVNSNGPFVLLSRCSRGSRVLQHCVTGETGEREDTGQREPNISGTGSRDQDKENRLET